MGKDFTHVFEDFADDLRTIYEDAWDRFGDEHGEEPDRLPSVCGECDDFDQCPIPGHGPIGKCRLSDEWRAESDDCDAYE